METTISTLKSPLQNLSGSQMPSQESGAELDGTLPPLSPNLALASKPELVPGAGRIEHLGATVTADGVNFAVYSESATAIWVCLFNELDEEIERFELDVHQDNIRAALIANIGPGARYGLRADGPYEPDQGFFFDPNKLLVDPYARILDRVFVRSPKLRLERDEAVDTAPLVPKAIVPGASNEPAVPRKKAPSLYYELNVRGFTMRHPSVQGPLRGTIAALTTKWVVDHFKHIGVDTIQLMPTAAWIDEGHLPALGLTNAWGYNPVAYFAVDPRLAPRGPQEMRVMTDTYRKANISVILDVVYNHTGEGDQQGPILSMMGLDPQTYYRFVEVDGKKHLVNDTGTGNTLRCDHPAVQRLVIDSLRYYVEECGVSGFRFDLATVLGRDPGFNADAEMLRKIKQDPVLSKCILVAEPWDPGPGGYAVGQFGKEFAEHNDTYRDEIRGFWKGESHALGALAGKVSGSAEIFDVAGRKPSHGVNMLAVHDGFTLRDLVSYHDKHNEANGEENRDGHSHNLSWNCGVEGETDDAGIVAARKRDVRAMLATLFFSRGVPLIQQGDEMYRTQHGNNNAYAQDNEITWVDWDNVDGDLVNYVAALNHFRRDHVAIHHDHFLTGHDKNGVRDVVWMHPDGREMNEGDWNDSSASVLGQHLRHKEDEVIIWYNRKIEPVVAHIPEGEWAVGIQSDTNADVPFSGATVTLPPRSVVVLVRPAAG
ncbi:glycogen debranching protein GlgX [Devosia sp. WQ 349K1]|uniref:glycogen debranching protein GlgX n=1 Tax=Devosia sp. WQ 349K1 TaxID=2800329 RepID=UPI0020B3B6A7|nr:glycogen debranching protein GlgX [Devosia sp. WQ 349K1]